VIGLLFVVVSISKTTFAASDLPWKLFGICVYIESKGHKWKWGSHSTSRPYENVSSFVPEILAVRLIPEAFLSFLPV
jgi:hypothetical protein